MNNLARKLGPGDDLEMIQSPWLWPYSFYLPMKHKTRKDPNLFNSPVTGLILAGKPTVVLLGTLGLTDWTRAARVEYRTVEALLADGWIVD